MCRAVARLHEEAQNPQSNRQSEYKPRPSDLRNMTLPGHCSSTMQLVILAATLAEMVP